MPEEIGFSQRIRNDSSFVVRGFSGDKDAFQEIVECRMINVRQWMPFSEVKDAMSLSRSPDPDQNREVG